MKSSHTFEHLYICQLGFGRVYFVDVRLAAKGLLVTEMPKMTTIFVKIKIRLYWSLVKLQVHV